MHTATTIVFIVMLVVFTYRSGQMWKQYAKTRAPNDLVMPVILDLIVIAGLLVLLFTS